MSSILTNNGAMVALQTLKSVNSNLAKTQAEISTGKTVETAKDNAAIWAISKIMESDVKGFKAISDSLSLGQSTVEVGRQAAETTTELLQDIKAKIVAAQESNVPRETIQNDISALRDQIKSVTNAAQFNGLNLVNGTDDVSILSSLDRNSDGTVVSSSISVARSDLTTEAGTYGNGGGTINSAITSSNTQIDKDANANQLNITFGGTATDGDTITLAGLEFIDNSNTAAARATAVATAINAANLTGITASDASGVLTLTNTNSFAEFEVGFDAGGANTFVVDNEEDNSFDVTSTSAAGTTQLSRRAEEVTLSGTTQVNEGDSYRITLGGTNYDYIAGKGETMEDIARGLKTAVDGGAVDGVSTQVAKEGDDWKVLIDYEGSAANISLADDAQEGGKASGGLFGLDKLDVTTDKGATAALDNIETLIQNSIDAAASFGSAQGRIETQSNFVSNMTDALKSGIGSMVDADMEEASARLQALQVQQQLATQSLSIANQAPQSILSLFR